LGSPAGDSRAEGYDLRVATTLTADRATLDDLEAALETVWSRATSADPAGWSHENPAWGQCAITALVVQDYLGGVLRRGEVGSISHYWNVLPSGDEVDLTRHQFGDEIEIANIESRTREYVLSHSQSARRYCDLARAVRDQLHLQAHAH
jgi:hypothetical protein